MRRTALASTVVLGLVAQTQAAGASNKQSYHLISSSKSGTGGIDGVIDHASNSEPKDVRQQKAQPHDGGPAPLLAARQEATSTKIPTSSFSAVPKQANAALGGSLASTVQQVGIDSDGWAWNFPQPSAVVSSAPSSILASTSTSRRSRSSTTTSATTATAKETNSSLVGRDESQKSTRSDVADDNPDSVRKAVIEALDGDADAVQQRDIEEDSHVLDVGNLPYQEFAPRASPTDGALSVDPKQWLRANVNLYRNTISSGTSNLAFVTDPAATDSASSSAVLRVFYAKGSYSLHNEPVGGSNFYSQPFLTANSAVGNSNTPYSTATNTNGGSGDPSNPQLLLSYSVYFPPGFDFVQGGKLPGLYSSVGAQNSDGTIDANTDGCSGGSDTGAGKSCWSVRVMWRTDGQGELYVYLPKTASGGYDLCASAVPTSKASGPGSIICNSGDYGVSIGRGAFKFTPGQWTQLALYSQINDVNKANGILRLFVNGSTTPAIEKTGLIMRTGAVATARSGNGGGSASQQRKRGAYDNGNQKWVDKIFFSSFFGGSTADFASSADTYAYFKDFSIFAGKQVSTAQGSSFTSSGTTFRIPCFLSLNVSLILAMLILTNA